MVLVNDIEQNRLERILDHVEFFEEIVFFFYFEGKGYMPLHIKTKLGIQ